MTKFISYMCLLLLAFSAVACAELPVTAGNSQDQQKANSREAQGELSTSVKR